MTAPWLAIVGLGEDGWDGLSAAARALVENAEIVAGGARHFELIPPPAAERLVWGNMRRDLEVLAALRGRRVCVLASGDPLWFGIGATIARIVPPAEWIVVPAAGAFSLAAARMGWPLQEVTTLSVHARPLEALNLHLAPGARLLLLTQGPDTPALIADLLKERGFGPSAITAFERLGGPAERRVDATAETWSGLVDPLNTVAVECRPGPHAMAWPRVAGLADDAYLHDGQLTKREVRAATLALLAPLPGELLWDVGAGCGSIAIEWARAGGRAIAFERDPEHCTLVATNAARLGVPEVAVRRATAPDELPLQDGAAPDAVFIGGGVSRPGMLEACWRALRPGGRLGANTVTAQGEAALLDWHARHGGEMVRVSVARLGYTGGFHGWRPLMPVTQYLGHKP